MAYLNAYLALDRCPHCSTNRPTLERRVDFESHDHAQKYRRVWGAYVCSYCGGAIIAAAPSAGAPVVEIYPEPRMVDDTLPDRAREYLRQAVESLHAPAGAVMLAASAVDAMLKEKGYKDGSLYSRITAAANAHDITPEMAKWAHEVRLDANDQRHSDLKAPLPTADDARRSVDFADALGLFLFTLPARVRTGLEEAGGATTTA